MTDRLTPELTVTVGTGWTYIGNNEALRLKAITGGCAVIEIARAADAFPDQQPAATEEP